MAKSRPPAPPDLEAARAALFDAGLKHRRAALGAAWIEKSLARRNAFNADFQGLITRFAWGEIWSRPGLDHKTRRFLVLGMTMAQGRWEEFRLHTRAGLAEGGFTWQELREVILQGAIYCGVPAANTAMNEAEAILNELGLMPEPAGTAAKVSKIQPGNI